MKILWEWSIESEAERLMEMSLKLSNGFYHLHHFLPLPFDLNHKRPNSSHHVYLPNLPYSTIPRYWESVSKLGVSYPLKQLNNISKSLTNLLTSLHLTSPDYPGIQKDVDTYLPLVINWLHTTFPGLPLPATILIHLSYFGTNGSFFFNKQQNTAILYLRHDQELYTLIEITLTALLRPHAGETLYTDWEKTEYLVDYLLLESSLTKLLPTPKSWQPTTIPPHYSQSLILESNQFISKIGLSVHEQNKFSLKDENIYFNNVQITDFSVKQHAILQALITRSPSPLTIDEIADIIFTKDEKFSLAAIGKTIERLRKKLASLGISSSYLATASGVGYYLKN